MRLRGRKEKPRWGVVDDRDPNGMANHLIPQDTTLQERVEAIPSDAVPAQNTQGIDVDTRSPNAIEVQVSVRVLTPAFPQACEQPDHSDAYTTKESASGMQGLPEYPGAHLHDSVPPTQASFPALEQFRQGSGSQATGNIRASSEHNFNGHKTLCGATRVSQHRLC